MCAVRTVPYHTRQALDIYRVSERTAETKHSKFAQSFTADMQVRKKVQKCCPLQKASFGASSCPNFHLPGYDSVSRIITVATTCQCDLLHPLYNFDNISRKKPTGRDCERPKGLDVRLASILVNKLRHGSPFMLFIMIIRL